MGNKDGLLHISELADFRVGKVTDIVNEGDMVKAKLIGIDDRGKVKLSIRMVDQETGEDISDQIKPKGERGVQEGPFLLLLCCGKFNIPAPFQKKKCPQIGIC